MLRRLLIVVVALGLLSACGSSGNTSSSGTTAAPATTAKGSGPVDVLYAGSLVALMQNQVGPGFHQATGYTVQGVSAGTTDLVTEIKGKTQKGDVFISAAPAANATLEGSSNGDWVSWYAGFATSKLLLGYNPKSRFAAQLKAKPWYDVVTEPGFKLGYTPPATDPKGVLAVKALDATAKAKHLPALKSITKDAGLQFPEETLVGRLQSGQLDAGFFYAAEAAAAKIPTVPLTGVDYSAGYTITILNKAPHPAAALAFVKYFLGDGAAPYFKRDGFDRISPAQVSGSGVPAALKSLTTGS